MKGASRTAATELALPCLVGIGLSLVSNTRETNYLGPIIPPLCLVLGLWLCRLIKSMRPAGLAISVVIGGLALSGWPITQRWIDRTRNYQWKNNVAKDLRIHAQMAQQLAVPENAGKPLAVIEADNHMLTEDFYLFYGRLDRPLVNLALDQLTKTRPGSPFVAISTTPDMDAAGNLLGRWRVQRSAGELACWEAE